VEGGGSPDAVRFIQGQRVRLNDAGITLQRAVTDLSFDGEVEQPTRCGRSDADAGFGTLGQDGVDDLDGARGVTKPMT
jgi:hypothetical protein